MGLVVEHCGSETGFWDSPAIKLPDDLFQVLGDSSGQIPQRLPQRCDLEPGRFSIKSIPIVNGIGTGL